MTRPVLLRAELVSKRFSRNSRPTLWNTFQDIAQQLTGSAPRDRLREGEFWALRDVSFEIRQGESVAIIGDNGAGKSTLIKLLMRRMLPTSGLVETRGSISALTVLGLGFDPVMSGRENIILNAATLGLSRRETLKVMDDIIDFAELREFIDTPIQTYSSGMKSRLGYAVAAHVNPDILLLDEVLAVGDISFRRKCRRHIKDFINRGGTTLLVTHDLHAAQTLCSRCIVLDRGRLLFDGSPAEGIHFYLENQLTSDDDETEEHLLRPGKSLPITSQAEQDDDTLPAAAMTQPPPEVEPIVADSVASLEFNDFPSMSVASETAAEQTDREAAPTQEVEESPSPSLTDEESSADDQSASSSMTQSEDQAVLIESVTMRATDGKHLRTDHGAELVMRYRSKVRIDGVVWGFTITTEDGLIHIATFIHGYSDTRYSVLPGFMLSRSVSIDFRFMRVDTD